MPAITTTAGRHAADRQREHLAVDFALEQQAARAFLAHKLRAHGLVVFADTAERPNVEPSIAVNCRVDSCAADRETVYALLDETGWTKHPSRFARHNGYGDFVPLVHPTTRATCWLIVKVPSPRVPQWEAA